jgi:ribosomal protein L7/L12
MIHFAILLSVSVFLSIIAAVSFGLVEVGNLKLNEFGDLLAGVVSAIAVIWLVISTITQQRELSAQREDIEETKRANIIQGEALQAATKIEAIRHLRELQQARLEYFGTLLSKLRTMLKRNLEKQDPHVAYLAWKEDLRKPIAEFYFRIIQTSGGNISKSQIHDPIPDLLRADITHDETVCAIDISGFIESFEKALKFLRERADELNVQAQQVEWESMLGLDHLLTLKHVAKRYAECAMEVYALHNRTVAAEFMRMSVDGTLAKGGALAMSWRVVSNGSAERVVERGKNVFPQESFEQHENAREESEHESPAEESGILGFISQFWRRRFGL